MIRWSFQPEKGCVPVAPSATPVLAASAKSSRRRAELASGAWRSRSASRVVTSISDVMQLAADVLGSSAGGGVAQLLEAADEGQRLGVEDLELLLEPDREVDRRCVEALLDLGEVGLVP